MSSISIGNSDFVNFLRMEPEWKYLLRLSHFIDLPWEASDKASDDCEPVCETLSMFKWLFRFLLTASNASSAIDWK